MSKKDTEVKKIGADLRTRKVGRMVNHKADRIFCVHPVRVYSEQELNAPDSKDLEILFSAPIKSTRGWVHTVRRTGLIRGILGISKYGNESANDFEIVKKKANRLIEQYVK